MGCLANTIFQRSLIFLLDLLLLITLVKRCLQMTERLYEQSLSMQVVQAPGRYNSTSKFEEGDGPTGFDILYLPFSSWAVECWQSLAWSLLIPPHSPPDCLRIGLGPGTLSYQEIVLIAQAGFITLCGNIFPVLDSVFVFFCLSLCAIWPGQHY